MVAKKPTAEDMSSSRIRDFKPQVSSVGFFGDGLTTSITVSPVLLVLVEVVLTVVFVGDPHFIAVVRVVRVDFLDFDLL